MLKILISSCAVSVWIKVLERNGNEITVRRLEVREIRSRRFRCLGDVSVQQVILVTLFVFIWWLVGSHLSGCTCLQDCIQSIVECYKRRWHWRYVWTDPNSSLPRFADSKRLRFRPWLRSHPAVQQWRCTGWEIISTSVRGPSCLPLGSSIVSESAQ